MPRKLVLVTGAGGFIGHHLVSYLVDRGYHVRGVDIKCRTTAPSTAHEFPHPRPTPRWKTAGKRCAASTMSTTSPRIWAGSATSAARTPRSPTTIR